MTYTSFVTALASLDITGVKRKYTSPPSQLSSTDLPASHPQLPESRHEVATLNYSPGLFAYVCELVIVVRANAQATAAANFSECLTLLDALNTALSDNAASLKIDRWSLRQDAIVYGDTAYWAIVARVEASE